MGVFDGFSLILIKHGNSLKYENGKYDVNDTYITSHIKATFPDLYIDEYLKLYAECVYNIDRVNDQEVIHTSNRVSKLLDKTLSELNAEQTTAAHQPLLCTTAQRHKKDII